MTAAERGQLARKLQDDLTVMHSRLEGLETQYRDLEVRYHVAGGHLKAEVHSDIEYIRSVRTNAEQILDILRGGTLFGRYSSDADHHMRIANRWRGISVVSLLSSATTAVTLSLLSNISPTLLTICLLPAFGMFFFASVESQNHRRREFDRRRIALRMAAIESYMQQRRSEGGHQEAWTVLEEFIREHFIEPALDSNDLSYMGPRFSIFTVFQRRSV